MKVKFQIQLIRPSFIIMTIMAMFVLFNSAEYVICDYFQIDIEHLETIIEDEQKEQEDIEEENLDHIYFPNTKNAFEENTEDGIVFMNYNSPSSKHIIKSVSPPPEYI